MNNHCCLHFINKCDVLHTVFIKECSQIVFFLFCSGYLLIHHFHWPKNVQYSYMSYNTKWLKLVLFVFYSVAFYLIVCVSVALQLNALNALFFYQALCHVLLMCYINKLVLPCSRKSFGSKTDSFFKHLIKNNSGKILYHVSMWHFTRIKYSSYVF